MKKKPRTANTMPPHDKPNIAVAKIECNRLNRKLTTKNSKRKGKKAN